MEANAKPGAGLLWAFELHRENQVLSKRLTAIETNAAKQQEEITNSERNAHSAQKENLDALDGRLKKLEHSDHNAQIERLTSDLQSTQRQLEEMRETVQHMEKANMKAESKANERDRDVKRRLEELTSALTRTENIVHGFEDRLDFATDHEVRSTVRDLEVSIERHEHHVENLGEQLRSLQQAQEQTRALLESARQDFRNNVTSSASAEPKVKDTPKATEALPSSSISARDGNLQNKSKSRSEAGQQPHSLEPPLGHHQSDSFMSIETNANMLATRTHQGKPTRPNKKKRDFEKELTQLLHRDGYLTNATPMPEGQVDGPFTRASKRLKIEPTQETQRETRSKVSKLKVEPAVTKAKPVERTEPVAADSSKRTTQTVRKAPKASALKIRGPKGIARPIKTSVLRQPLPSSSSSTKRVSETRSLKKSKQQPAASGSPMLSKPKEIIEQQQMPHVPQRRRLILQDDSMEEFLAKCQAATGS